MKTPSIYHFISFLQDLLRSLMKQGGGKELFILGATGSLSYVELLNDDEDPVENTILNVRVSLHLFFEFIVAFTFSSIVHLLIKLLNVHFPINFVTRNK